MARPGAALMAAKGKSGIHIKPSRVGSLHTALGVPQGEPIPASKIAGALATGGTKLKRKAQFAQNAKSFNH